MAAKIFHKAQKMFNKSQGVDDAADGTKEEDEGVAPRTRFADADPTAAAGKKKPGSKKEVRVKEPPSEDGEEQKAKVTSIKKSGDKKGPPSVSYLEQHVQSVILITIFMALPLLSLLIGREKEDQ